MKRFRPLPAAFLLLLTFFCAAMTAAEKPNIILFLVDDMGLMDCGANGSTYYETPHIDALARRGMRFTAATVHPMCSPTRAMLMSGQYSARHGLTAATGQQPPQPDGFAFMPKSAPAKERWIHPISKNYLDASQITLAEALRAAGYRTGHFGKWHLGLEERHWPEAQGFDEAFHCHPDPGPPGFYFSPYGVVPSGTPHDKDTRIGTITDGPPGEYIVDRLATEAARFIEQNKNRPFFLNLWQYGVHGPWGAKEEDVKRFVAKKDPSGRQGNPIMAAMLKSVDDALGTVVAAVEKAGLTDRTIILFLSDNGGEDHELPASAMTRKAARTKNPVEQAIASLWKQYAPDMTPTSNAPLKNGKGWLYEGGTRVPFIVAWPGKIPVGVCDTPISGVDVYPTLLSLASVGPPPTQKLDGLSIAPLLTGNGKLPERPVFNFFPHGNGAKPPGVTVRLGRLKLIRWFYTSNRFPAARELYDLEKDPSETRNLAVERPGDVNRLDALLDTFLRDTGALIPVPNPAFKSIASQAKAMEPMRDLRWFLTRLRTVDHFPELEDSHTAMSSTWDRSGNNGDGLDFKRVEGGQAGRPARNVLLDIQGPGCIHRMFVGTLTEQQAKTRIQIFLDGSDVPLFDLPIRKFFDYENGPFPYPLAFHKTYPGTLLPIPFAKHCLVQLVNEDCGTAQWNDLAWGNFWQITWTKYGGSVKVHSLNWPPTTAERSEIQKTVNAWLAAESAGPEAPLDWGIDRTFSIPTGDSAQIRLPGPAVVRRIQLQSEPATPEVLQQLWMRITWDEAAKPSVDVPVGYFFGHAHTGEKEITRSIGAVLDREGSRASHAPTDFHSLIMGRSKQDVYCCFPMPFEKNAVVSFHNASPVAVSKLRVRIASEPVDRLPDTWGRFHATFHQAPAATAESPTFGPRAVPGHLILDQEGRGKYVGLMLSLDWPHTDWWGEGDFLIWTDQARNAWPPDYHGTGSEEYFNSGWCRFDRKAISGFVALHPGYPTVYSFHFNDAFQFQQRIRVVEEQMGNDIPARNLWTDTRIRQTHPLWTTTAYWYGLPAKAAGSRAISVADSSPINKPKP